MGAGSPTVRPELVDESSLEAHHVVLRVALQSGPGPRASKESSRVGPWSFWPGMEARPKPTRVELLSRSTAPKCTSGL